ncbi:uncharacterized protein LOC105736422 [Apis florea]|uniref:uncharacterized protein LOC105736422 n=1 Tax=Apis florea TaxID=7463 RepID=UPI0012FF5119|nr:uncharacterized protein LOC105736422 [Apis florea]
MLYKLFNVLVIFLVIQTICTATYTNISEENYLDIQQIEEIENLLTFYDLKTGIPLKEESIDLKKDGSISTTVYSAGCSCENYSCGCCVGIKILWIKGPLCLSVGIDVGNISIFIKLTMNKKTIISKSISCKYFLFF